MFKSIPALLLCSCLVTPAIALADSDEKSQQISITGNNNNLHIQVIEDDGKIMEIELELDDDTTGEVAKAVLADLREKGIYVEGDGQDNFHIEIDSTDAQGEIEGLDMIQSLKLLKGLEILKELEGLKALEGNTKISIEIEVDKETEQASK